VRGGIPDGDDRHLRSSPAQRLSQNRRPGRRLERRAAAIAGWKCRGPTASRVRSG
jgi:hypothetical protein